MTYDVLPITSTTLLAQNTNEHDNYFWSDQ